MNGTYQKGMSEAWGCGKYLLKITSTQLLKPTLNFHAQKCLDVKRT